MPSVYTFPDLSEKLIKILETKMSMCLNLRKVHELIKTLKPFLDESLESNIDKIKTLMDSAALILNKLIGYQNEISAKGGNYHYLWCLMKEARDSIVKVEKEIKLLNPSKIEKVLQELHIFTEVFLNCPTSSEEKEIFKAIEDITNPPARILSPCDPNIPEITPKYNQVTFKKNKKRKKHITDEQKTTTIVNSVSPSSKKTSSSDPDKDVDTSTEFVSVAEDSGQDKVPSASESSVINEATTRSEKIGKAEELLHEIKDLIENIKELLSSYRVADESALEFRSSSTKSSIVKNLTTKTARLCEKTLSLVDTVAEIDTDAAQTLKAELEIMNLDKHVLGNMVKSGLGISKGPTKEFVNEQNAENTEITTRRCESFSHTLVEQNYGEGSEYTSVREVSFTEDILQENIAENKVPSKKPEANFRGKIRSFATLKKASEPARRLTRLETVKKEKWCNFFSSPTHSKTSVLSSSLKTPAVKKSTTPAVKKSTTPAVKKSATTATRKISLTSTANKRGASFNGTEKFSMESKKMTSGPSSRPSRINVHKRASPDSKTPSAVENVLEAKKASFAEQISRNDTQTDPDCPRSFVQTDRFVQTENWLMNSDFSADLIRAAVKIDSSSSTTGEETEERENSSEFSEKPTGINFENNFQAFRQLVRRSD